MACPICDKRKAKRFCPAKAAKICSICCGAHREVTITCPLECPYLIEARRHERPPEPPPPMPYPEVRITTGFHEERATLISAVGHAALAAALETPGAADGDLREALEALIRTYRTLESGLIYETRPTSPYARDVAAAIRSAVEEFRREETEQAGLTGARDSDVRQALVFWLRAAVSQDNGKPKGRALIHLMSQTFGTPEEQTSPLITPGFR